MVNTLRYKVSADLIAYFAAGKRRHYDFVILAAMKRPTFSEFCRRFGIGSTPANQCGQ
jgi:hypothetical protein